MSRPLCQMVLHGVLTNHTDKVQPLQLTPKDVEVELNDYRSADTFRATVAWQTFPFDPRAFGALGVDIYLGPAGSDGQLALNADTLLLSGLVDRPQLRSTDSGVEWSLEGRDFTALFADWKWTRTLALGRLSQMAGQIIAEVPGAAPMQATLSGLDDLSLAHKGRTRYSAPKDADAWTVMTELARLAGAVVFVRGHQVVFAAPRNLFPRDLAPTLIWGRDLSSLEYGSELQGGKRQGVKVISRDPATGVVNSVLYPATSRKTVVKSNRRGTVQTEHYLEWVLANVPKEHLPTIAQRVYELQARRQLRGTLETRRLLSLDRQTNVWQLRHGSALKLQGPSELAGSLATLPPAVAVGQLTAGAFRMERMAAEALVANARALNATQSPVYVQKASHHWSADAGYRLTAEFINFLEL